MNFPEGLKYSDTHHWVKAGGSFALLGLTDHAQKQLGEVIFVDLPELGQVLQVGQEFGSVEAVKTVADLYAPLSGEVISINEHLLKVPSAINTSPYDKGWLIKIKVTSNSGDLLDANAYKQMIGA